MTRSPGSGRGPGPFFLLVQFLLGYSRHKGACDLMKGRETAPRRQPEELGAWIWRVASHWTCK